MEFKSLKNIETSFKKIRLFGIIFLLMCTIIVSYSLWKSYQFAEKQREKIYVLDDGKSLMLALSQELSQNRPVEAKEHVKRFHELFYTLSPDKNAIESNIQRSLFLADRSAFIHYKNLDSHDCLDYLIISNYTTYQAHLLILKSWFRFFLLRYFI